jgi:hypothetical protein
LRLEQDFDLAPIKRARKIGLKHAGVHAGLVSVRGSSQ